MSRADNARTTRPLPGPSTGCHAKNTTLDAGREAPPPAGLVVPLQHPLLTKSKTEPGVKGEMFKKTAPESQNRAKKGGFGIKTQ